MADIPVSALTAATLDGQGVFDTLMRANKAHLEAEFSKGRIKGPEYATVYLGSLQAVMQTALTFLVQSKKLDLEAQLLTQQITLAGVQLQIAQAELAIAQANQLKVPAEIAEIEAKTALITQQQLNAITEGLVLQAQKCKLDAEYDVLLQTKLKTVEEIGLLAQKKATETAQTVAMGVDADSVIGRQKGLYLAQTSGFTRDAEQKAAKLMVDSWNVRRTTDEATVADGVNMLNDVAVGRAVNKLLTGVGA